MTKRNGCVMLLAVAMLAVGTLLVTAQNRQAVQGIVVFKSTGRGVPNAEVTYTRADQPPRVTRTNAAGEFAFDTRELGVVTVALSGYAVAHRRWPPAAGNRVVVELESPAAVSGVLMDSNNMEPRSGGVTVVVEQPPDQFVSTTVEVGADGTFSVENLPAGSVTLIAKADGSAPTVTTFDLDEGVWWTEHVSVPAMVVLKGLVVDAYSQPVAGADVLIEYQMVRSGGVLAGFVGGRITTDGDGNFALTNLRPGEMLSVWAEHEDRRSNVETVMLDPLNPLDVVLRVGEDEGLR